MAKQKQQQPLPKYNFQLTVEEASNIITALKKFPMEQVEALVANMDNQFVTQVKAEQEALQNKPSEVVSEANSTTSKKKKVANA